MKPLHLGILIFLSLSGLIVFNAYHYSADEGYYLAAASRVAAGQVPHRDFFHLYPPLTTILLLPAGAIGGEWGLLIGRIIVVLWTLGSAVLLYSLARVFLDEDRSFLATLGFSLFNYLKFPFLSPSAVANTLAIGALLVMANRKQLGRWYFPALGFVLSLCMLAKQNIGVYVAGAVFVAHLLFAWHHAKKELGKELLRISISCAAPFAVLLGYMALTSFADARYQMFTFLGQFILINPLSHLGELILVTGGLLLLIGVVLGLGIIGRQDKASLAAIGLYLVGAALLCQGLLYKDFVHFFDGCALLPLIFLHQSKVSRARLAQIGALCLLVLLCLAALRTTQGMWMNNYRGVDPMISHGLIVSAEIDELFIVAAEAKTMPLYSIFAYPNTPILYTLIGANPTSYNQIVNGYHNSTQEQEALIARLRAKEPTLIINTEQAARSNYPLLNEYLANTTQFAQTKHFSLRTAGKI